MLFDTRFRWALPGLLALALVGLGSGCQTSRPGFAFQPAPRTEARALVPPAVPVAPAAAATQGALNCSPAPRRLRVRLAKRPPAPPQPRPDAASAVMRPVAGPHQIALHRRALMHRAHAPAEVGLGTTVLGVLGLVTLPIALIGLVLSGGGLVWALVAAAAALAVLVAYLDPVGKR